MKGMGSTVVKKHRTVRPSYRAAIAWIALNDEPDETNEEEIKLFLSVCLVADLFDKHTDIVAADVVKHKKKESKHVPRTR